MDRFRTVRGAALVALTLAACSDIAGPLPEAGVPDQLEFAVSGFAMPSRTLQVRGDTVVFHFRSWGGEPGAQMDSVKRIPSAAEWAAFWIAAEEAGVRRWRSDYLAEHVVDGGGWSLRLAAEGTVIESTGTNAYPDSRGRESELEPTPAFETLVAALSQLAGVSIY